MDTTVTLDRYASTRGRYMIEGTDYRAINGQRVLDSMAAEIDRIMQARIDEVKQRSIEDGSKCNGTSADKSSTTKVPRNRATAITKWTEVRHSAPSRQRRLKD